MLGLIEEEGYLVVARIHTMDLYDVVDDLINVDLSMHRLEHVILQQLVV